MGHGARFVNWRAAARPVPGAGAGDLCRAPEHIFPTHVNFLSGCSTWRAIVGLCYMHGQPQHALHAEARASQVVHLQAPRRCG
jgi:hypothetical protein